MVSYFKPSKYVRTKNISETSDLLVKHGDRALIVGGGTLIHSLAARGVLAQVDVLVDIQDLGLDYVQQDDKGLRIGAMTRFSELEQVPEIMHNPTFGALRDALEYPPNQIKSIATVGGSIASSFVLFDIPIALLSLGATIHMNRGDLGREINLENLFQDYFVNTLQRGEFITELLLPSMPKETTSSFVKLETNANDLAIINIATSLTFDSDTCKDARIFVGGGVGSVPIRTRTVEEGLRGKALTQAVLDEVSQHVGSDVKPIDDHRASSRYRMHVTNVLMRRALSRALTRTEQIRAIGGII